jgi:hypothetical protein
MSGRSKALIASAVAGLLVASLMMAMAWQHNPQGRFHESGVDGRTVIHWGAWSLVGVSWFVPVAGGVLLGTALCFGIRAWRNRRRQGTLSPS